MYLTEVRFQNGFWKFKRTLQIFLKNSPISHQHKYLGFTIFNAYQQNYLLVVGNIYQALPMCLLGTVLRAFTMPFNPQQSYEVSQAFSLLQATGCKSFSDVVQGRRACKDTRPRLILGLLVLPPYHPPSKNLFLIKLPNQGGFHRTTETSIYSHCSLKIIMHPYKWEALTKN